jgi:hypothetical protein
LPEGYFAELNVQFAIEIDVAAFNEMDFEPNVVRLTGPIKAGWTAPAPTLTIPLPIITDVVEVLVFDREAGPTLAGAIELLSPSNKDRPSSRDAFVTKCAAYIQQGLGLVIVDVVTDRHSHWYDELLKRLGWTKDTAPDADLSAAACRAVDRSGQTSLDIWQESLELGLVLPAMPLWLRGNLFLRSTLKRPMSVPAASIGSRPERSCPKPKSLDRASPASHWSRRALVHPISIAQANDSSTRSLRADTYVAKSSNRCEPRFRWRRTI